MSSYDVVITSQDYQMADILDPPSWISGFPQNFRKAPELNKKVRSHNQYRNVRAIKIKVTVFSFKNGIFPFLKKKILLKFRYHGNSKVNKHESFPDKFLRKKKLGYFKYQRKFFRFKVSTGRIRPATSRSSSSLFTFNKTLKHQFCS